MEVKVCKNCKKLFKYIYGPDLCPDCAKLAILERIDQNEKSHPLDSQSTEPKQTLTSAVKDLVREEEAKFKQIRDYIIAHPSASVAQIADANGVAPSVLFRWIKDDRLEFSSRSDTAWLTCSVCGARIKSGRICERCKI